MYTLKLAVDWWACYLLVNLDQTAELVPELGLSGTIYRYFRSAVLLKHIKKKKITRLINVYCTHTMLSAIQPALHGFFMAGKFKCNRPL